MFVVAFFVGSFDFYRGQIAEISLLRSQIERLHADAKRASLFLGIHDRSAFFRHAPQQGQVAGIYFHLDVSVENKGARASVISKYHLRIEETGTDEDVRPRGFSGIQGLNFMWGLDTARTNLAPDGYIRVQPDSLAGPEILPFYIPITPEAECHALHCELSLEDTNGERASVQFELHEHR